MKDTSTRNITCGLEKGFHLLESSAPNVEGRMIFLITHGTHNAAGTQPGILSTEIQAKRMFNILIFIANPNLKKGLLTMFFRRYYYCRYWNK